MPRGIELSMPSGIVSRETLESEMTLAGERYLKLIEDLALEDRAENPSLPAAKEDSRFARGWQGRICAQLGIKQPHVSKLWNGAQQPTIDVIELAQEKQRVRYEYFHEKKLTSPHFRDYQRGRRVPLMGYKAFHDFVALCPQMGINLSESEIATLRYQEWDGEPTPDTYRWFLQALRTIPPAQTRVREKPTATSA